MATEPRGNGAPTAAPVTSIGTEGHTVHLFESGGRIVAVDVFEVGEGAWMASGRSFGPLCSSSPLGGGRLRVVRLTL
jgi:hypothetical protein